MGFRFRRTLKILPGVRLNFSARGVSASVGPRGASMTFGSRGTYANLGVPGTGMSWRERVDAPRPRAGGAGARAEVEADERPVGAAAPVETPGPAEVARDAEAGDVARMIPLWPWVSLLVGGIAVALGTGGGAGLLLGLVAAVIGGAGAVGVPAHRAELQAHLHEREGME